MPDLAEASGASGPVGWEHYQGAKAKFVPSVVSTNGIDDMKDFFAGAPAALPCALATSLRGCALAASLRPGGLAAPLRVAAPPRCRCAERF